jgi:metal-responsive CopG/Arc/MetJ family transcriptional regulator
MRTKTRVVVELPERLVAWLDRQREERGTTRTWLITKALDNYRSQSEKSPHEQRRDTNA